MAISRQNLDTKAWICRLLKSNSSVWSLESLVSWTLAHFLLFDISLQQVQPSRCKGKLYWFIKILRNIDRLYNRSKTKILSRQTFIDVKDVPVLAFINIRFCRWKFNKTLLKKRHYRRCKIIILVQFALNPAPLTWYSSVDLRHVYFKMLLNVFQSLFILTVHLKIFFQLFILLTRQPLKYIQVVKQAIQS